jgi:hypothetical protein
MKVVFSLTFGLALLWSTSTFAADTQRSLPDPGQIVLVADSEGGLPVDAILHLEPGHLVALGVGLVFGAAVIGPFLGIGEVVGVAAGVIGGELAYRSGLLPFQKTRGWLE